MLSFRRVSKRFDRGRPAALDAVSFEVDKGSICGLLGHNGAGKSTALGVMLGMVYPDAGDVLIGGCPVLTERHGAIRKVGAIFEAPAFYEYLSGWHNLKILTAYSGAVERKLLEETVEWVGLGERIHDRVGTYSHGMRQRLALAQALLPRPEVLILDEPTDGLDPEGIFEFREQLLTLREELGLTVLLSSHLLGEVEQVCDEVVILQRGVKVYEGKVRGINEGWSHFVIESENPEVTGESIKAQRGKEAGEFFQFPSEVTAADLLSKLVADGARITKFSEKEESLEELYLKFSQGSSEGSGQ
ncbi:MAG: ABC transporter [Verrucomicrobiales bacterium]|nr:ABC transporter [Verrucomicrobiales bacterium]